MTDESAALESRADFARRLHCKRSYVTDLANAGRLVLSADGKLVDWKSSLARIEATRDPSKAATVARHAAARTQPAPSTQPEAQTAPSGGDSDPADQPYGDTDYQVWRARREKANALSAERDLAVSLRALIPADDVRALITEAATLFRQQIESLPDRVAPQLAGISEEQRIRLLLADDIEQALRDLSHRLEGAAA